MAKTSTTSDSSSPKHKAENPSEAAELELALKRAELALKEKEAETKGQGMAFLGLSLWGAIAAIVSTMIQGCQEHNASLTHEREKLQATLIERAVTGVDHDTAKANLRFLAESGLLEDDPEDADQKFQEYILGLDKNKNSIPSFGLLPSLSSPISVPPPEIPVESLYDDILSLMKEEGALVKDPTGTGVTRDHILEYLSERHTDWGAERLEVVVKGLLIRGFYWKNKSHEFVTNGDRYFLRVTQLNE